MREEALTCTFRDYRKSVEEWLQITKHGRVSYFPEVDHGWFESVSILFTLDPTSPALSTQGYEQPVRLGQCDMARIAPL